VITSFHLPEVLPRLQSRESAVRLRAYNRHCSGFASPHHRLSRNSRSMIEGGTMPEAQMAAA